MKCYIVRPHLEKMATGEIDGVLLRRLEEHLQTCPGCRGEYQAMKQALELWRQASRLEPVPQFSPAWRQGIRQKAFEKEAGGHSFFSVFKTNTLIPALGVLAVLLVIGVFNILNRFAPKVEIEPQLTRYCPTMSSTIGIPLTVKPINGKIPSNITYHWIAEYGQFLSWNGKVAELGTDIRTRESKVYWSVKYKDEREGSSFYIRLEVEDRKTGKVIARAKLKLEKDEAGFYVVGI